MQLKMFKFFLVSANQKNSQQRDHRRAVAVKGSIIIFEENLLQ